MKKKLLIAATLGWSTYSQRFMKLIADNMREDVEVEIFNPCYEGRDHYTDEQWLLINETYQIPAVAYFEDQVMIHRTSGLTACVDLVSKILKIILLSGEYV